METVLVSKLMAARRWVNVTKVKQNVMDRKQSDFRTVLPGGYVEGEQYAEVLKFSRTMREVLDHLTQQQIYKLVQPEKDLSLLSHLANVEKYSKKPRTSIIRILEGRIKVLESGKPLNKEEQEALAKEAETEEVANAADADNG